VLPGLLLRKAWLHPGNVASYLPCLPKRKSEGEHIVRISLWTLPHEPSDELGTGSGRASPHVTCDAYVISLAKRVGGGYNNLCKEEISDNARKEEVA
jgi:hypothetical protein